MCHQKSYQMQIPISVPSNESSTQKCMERQFDDAWRDQSPPFSSIALLTNYSDVIKGVMASQITCVSNVCSTVCLGADQRKHQRSGSLAFVKGIHRWSRKMFSFDDVILGFPSHEALFCPASVVYSLSPMRWMAICIITNGYGSRKIILNGTGLNENQQNILYSVSFSIMFTGVVQIYHPYTHKLQHGLIWSLSWQNISAQYHTVLYIKCIHRMNITAYI